ncbi:MAG: hypothetical protein ABGZ17_16785 [Planctomycetaceae bacterium]
MQQVMHDYAGLGFGLVLVIMGIACLVAQQARWRKQVNDASIDVSDRQYLGRRHRRRLQISGMLVLIGMMIAIGDTVVDWRQSPANFVMFWCVALLLALWVMILGFSDMLSTQTHVRSAEGQRAQIESELRRELERLKRLKQQDSNGSHQPPA